MANEEKLLLWQRFTLREGILLAFCATFIVITRAGLMLNLKIPGHVMLFMAFFLILSRGCVPKIGAPTLVGLISGIVSILIGMGKSGPLTMVKFLFPAIIVDIAGMIYPRFPTSYLASIIVGLLLSAGRSLTTTGIEYAVGMETEIVLQKAAIMAFSHALFGSIGSALVPPIIKRLKANRLIK